MTIETVAVFFSERAWAGNLLTIALAFLLAWMVSRLSWRIAGRLVTLNRFTPSRRTRPERLRTLRGLLASAISFLALIIATLVSLGQFVAADTLIWIVGLFSAAFGLGARPLVNDFLSGISFIFEDTYDVGDKVQILDIEGTVERVYLRTTWLRATNGELFIVPNGEVRVVRNFSRSEFSASRVTLKLPATDLEKALALLHDLSEEVVTVLPDLLARWQIISETGTIGQHTELTVLFKARFGKGADLRPRLLAYLQKEFDKAGIELVD